MRGRLSPTTKVASEIDYLSNHDVVDSRFRGNDGGYAKVSVRGNDGLGRQRPGRGSPFVGHSGAFWDIVKGIPPYAGVRSAWPERLSFSPVFSVVAEVGVLRPG